MDLYIAYLDREHLADRLFMQGLAQALSESPSGEPKALLLHGSGEKVERTLEAEGLFPGRVDGVLDVSEREHLDLVERAVREVNQEVVGTLTDEVVSTVGIQGVDRGLLHKAPGEPLKASNTGWLSALLKQHVVPVVSALVEAPDTGKVQEVPAVEAVRALAQGLEASFDPVVCVLASGDVPGESEGETPASITADALTEEAVPEPAVARHLALHLPVLVTDAQGLLGGSHVRGARVDG